MYFVESVVLKSCISFVCQCGQYGECEPATEDNLLLVCETDPSLGDKYCVLAAGAVLSPLTAVLALVFSTIVRLL